LSLALPISAWGIAERAAHQLPGCRSAAEAVREARRTEALREAGGWVTSRCFGWAGFWMLRVGMTD